MKKQAFTTKYKKQMAWSPLLSDHYLDFSGCMGNMTTQPCSTVERHTAKWASRIGCTRVNKIDFFRAVHLKIFHTLGRVYSTERRKV